MVCRKISHGENTFDEKRIQGLVPQKKKKKFWGVFGPGRSRELFPRGGGPWRDDCSMKRLISNHRETNRVERGWNIFFLRKKKMIIFPIECPNQETIHGKNPLATVERL